MFCSSYLLPIPNHQCRLSNHKHVAETRISAFWETYSSRGPRNFSFPFAHRSLACSLIYICVHTKALHQQHPGLVVTNHSNKELTTHQDLERRSPSSPGAFIPVTGKLVIRHIHIKQFNGLASAPEERGNFRK